MAIIKLCVCDHLGIVAEINLAIGAAGVVSGECKMIVEQYGDQTTELLLEEVLYSANSCTSCRTVLHLKIITLMAPACHIEQEEFTPFSCIWTKSVY